jgi:hypothetical protein
MCAIPATEHLAISLCDRHGNLPYAMTLLFFFSPAGWAGALYDIAEQKENQIEIWLLRQARTSLKISTSRMAL